jgi:hypothetical protein
MNPYTLGIPPDWKWDVSNTAAFDLNVYPYTLGIPPDWKYRERNLGKKEVLI